MKISAHSKDTRGNELITYQFEAPTYLLPEILYCKNKMEITYSKSYSKVSDNVYALNSASHKIALKRELLKQNKIQSIDFDELLLSKTMEKKYELTETAKIAPNGETLYQIRALKDFTLINGKEIKKGDLGGWVTSEDRLSHDGNCWIYDNCMMYGNSYRSENSIGFGYSWQYGHSCQYGNSRQFDNSMQSGNSRQFDNSQQSGNSQQYGKSKQSGNSQQCGNSRQFKN